MIELPPKMSTADDADLCPWMLRRPAGTPDIGPVRMVDFSGLSGPVDVPRE
ncbi:MAG: hypothetical protein ACRDP7_49495 [Trebonia sp.]